MPFTPSPGSPKIASTPQSISLVTNKSATVLDIATPHNCARDLPLPFGRHEQASLSKCNGYTRLLYGFVVCSTNTRRVRLARISVLRVFGIYLVKWSAGIVLVRFESGDFTLRAVSSLWGQ